MKKYLLITGNIVTNNSGTIETRDDFRNGACIKWQAGKGRFLRRPLLFVLLCLSYSAALLAANPVTVHSGNISVIKRPVIALLEINFADTNVENETIDEYLSRRGKVFIREWRASVESTNTSLPKFFNSTNKKGMQLTTKAIDASYKFVIYVDYLNTGDSHSGTIAQFANPWFIGAGKAGGMLMQGTVDIIDLRTGKVVCSLDVNGIKGKGNMSFEHRLQSMLNYLAQTICRIR